MDKTADEAEWWLKEAPDVARRLAQHEANPLIQRLFAYWSRLPRPDDGYPARKDLDPVQIGTGLPWIWIADVVGPPLRFRHRLVGTAHGKALGTDVTGKWLEEASPAFHNSASYSDLVRVATQGIISYRHGNSVAALVQKGFERRERIAMPLASDGWEIDGLLGMTVYDARIPAWAR